MNTRSHCLDSWRNNTIDFCRIPLLKSWERFFVASLFCRALYFMQISFYSKWREGKVFWSGFISAQKDIPRDSSFITFSLFGLHGFQILIVVAFVWVFKTTSLQRLCLSVCFLWVFLLPPLDKKFIIKKNIYLVHISLVYISLRFIQVVL